MRDKKQGGGKRIEKNVQLNVTDCSATLVTPVVYVDCKGISPIQSTYSLIPILYYFSLLQNTPSV